METDVKFTVLGIMITAVLVTSPAFAQYGSPGGLIHAGASATKDDSWGVGTRLKKHVESHKQKKHMSSGASGTENGSWSVATRTKKHVESHKQKKQMASHKQDHHAKTMNPKVQTTGSTSSSAPGPSTSKDYTTPKSQ
jgi:hypothetical protein